MLNRVLMWVFVVGLFCGLGAARVAAAEDTATRSVINPADNFFDVSVQSSGHIYVIGASGAALRSVDRGDNWDRLYPGVKTENLSSGHEDYFSVAFEEGTDRGWIVGDSGLILFTEDGGDNWSQQESGAETALFRVRSLGGGKACAVGFNGLLLWTDDAGETWNQSQFKDYNFFDVAFVDEQNGWAVGEFNTVLQTIDSGRTWNVQYGGGTNDFTVSPFFSIVFVDSTIAWIAGLDGAVLVSETGGATWTEKKLATSPTVYRLDRAGQGVFGVGPGGKMVRLEDDGRLVDIPTAQDLTSVSFSGDLGFTVGFGGTILRTEDGGKHWASVGLP